MKFMRLSTLTHAGLILGILILIGLSAGPVSATDDNSWFTPASQEQILAWGAKNVLQNAGFFNTLTPYTTANFLPGDNAWFTPATQEQILAWGAKNTLQNAALIRPRPTSAVPITTFTPYTLSRADLDKLLGKYKSGINGPATPDLPATPIPTTPAAPSSAPTGDDLHTLDGTSVSLLINRAMDGYRTNPQMPITIPVKPVYSLSPDWSIAPSPTQTPSGGSSDQGTGISLSAFNLQDKFVRISNTGITPVVLTGWKITNRQGNSLTFINFPLGGGSTFTFILNPYSTLTVYFGKDGVITSTELYYPAGGNFWNAQGDTASLYNDQGRLVGSISA
jgi:hypothetical protein